MFGSAVRRRFTMSVNEGKQKERVKRMKEEIRVLQKKLYDAQEESTAQYVTHHHFVPNLFMLHLHECQFEPFHRKAFIRRF